MPYFAARPGALVTESLPGAGKFPQRHGRGNTDQSKKCVLFSDDDTAGFDVVGLLLPAAWAVTVRAISAVATIRIIFMIISSKWAMGPGATGPKRNGPRHFAVPRPF